jgi:hypothetical protein
LTPSLYQLRVVLVVVGARLFFGFVANQLIFLPPRLISLRLARKLNWSLDLRAC